MPAAHRSRSSLLAPALLGLVVLVGWCTTTRVALAYCLSTTTEPPSSCECSREGFVTHWDQDFVSYTLNERGFPGLSDETLRATIARSFAHWTQVSCDGEPVVLAVKQQRDTTAMRKEHHRDGSDRNVIAHLSAEEFLELSDLTSSSDAFALTTTFTDLKTGKLFGADIMFNGALGPFVICPESGCPRQAVDLENVATHEIGHFLGLGHSEVDDSTMACSAPKGELQKRTLEADDEAGICEIYGAIAVDEREQSLHHETTRAGCGCRVQNDARRTRSQSWGSALVLGLFFARRRLSLARRRLFSRPAG